LEAFRARAQVSILRRPLSGQDGRCQLHKKGTVASNLILSGTQHIRGLSAGDQGIAVFYKSGEYDEQDLPLRLE
jgi:hypothetical protein